MSAETRMAVEALADPCLPYRLAIHPVPRWVQAEDTNPDHFAYRLAPTCPTEWHRWRLLELAYRFWGEGGRNDEALLRAHSWAFRQDPHGVDRLWECVGRDVEAADHWLTHHEEAPIWWLVHDAHPKTAQIIEGAFRNYPAPDVKTQVSIGGVGYLFEVSRRQLFDWNWLASLIGDMKVARRGKKKQISGDRLKAEYSRVRKAEIAWKLGFERQFESWRSRREGELRSFIARGS